MVEGVPKDDEWVDVDDVPGLVELNDSDEEEKKSVDQDEDSGDAEDSDDSQASHECDGDMLVVPKGECKLESYHMP